MTSRAHYRKGCIVRNILISPSERTAIWVFKKTRTQTKPNRKKKIIISVEFKRYKNFYFVPWPARVLTAPGYISYYYYLTLFTS